MALFLIGCLSFYLDIENFTDRAMVVLITMIVIATITSSIQAVSFVLTSNVFLSRFVCISIFNSFNSLNQLIIIQKRTYL